jgi:sterol desaturase/sphingolipid hydroxylase (fatty acid hydroxylase superfamily)
MPGDHGSFIPVALILARSLVWLALASAVFVPLERLVPLQRGPRAAGELAENLGWHFVNTILTVSLLALLLRAGTGALHQILPGAMAEAVGGLPLGLRAALAMLVGEVGFYWGHRWSHEWAWLWRFHAVHHSATRIGFLVNTRFHPVDMIFTRICGVIPLYALGLASPVAGSDGVLVVLVLLTGSLWSYFVHANLRVRFGWLEWLIATPAFHHWHHSRHDHPDHNYAAMLPLLDRLFGTWHLPPRWPDAYGSDTPVPPGVAAQLIAPFKDER